MSADTAAPGPGLWERDPTHQAAPMTPYVASIFPGAFQRGFAAGASRYGLLLEGMDIRPVAGWLYFRPRPVGAPEKPGRLPPRPLFKLLLRAHPELRRRARAAARATSGRTWREEAARWHGGLRDRFVERSRELQAVEVAAAGDEELRAHVDAATRHLAAGLEAHFHHTVPHMICVGDWAGSVGGWTGEEPAATLAALRGASPASVATIAPLDLLAREIERTPEAAVALRGGDPAAALAGLRASSPRVGAMLDGYLDEFGHRLVTGLDLDARTALELPETIVATIAARLEDVPAGGPSDGDAAAAALRERVPAEHRERFDELLDDARLLYGLRDDDVGPTCTWPAGLLRRALLAAGTRLSGRGALEHPEDVFEARPDEVAALLERREPAPSATELFARRAARRRSALAPPPIVLGDEEGPPPPAGWLPAALGRVHAAVLLALVLEDGANGTGPREAGSQLGGNGASGGRYEGRARVVRGPADFGKLERGDVLVAPTTSPAYNVVLPLLGAVVTDTGGVLCHAAIVAREFGIPAVVGVTGATARIPDGARIVVDADRGLVRLA